MAITIQDASGNLWSVTTVDGLEVIFLTICYAVAFVAGMITRPEIPTWYATLAKPAWRPPNWLFGPVWTVLSGLMAIAGWKVWCAASSKLRTTSLWIIALQLTLIFLWSRTFFSLHHIDLAFFVIASLAMFLLLFIALTWKFERVAGLFPN
jgi:translocator protein